MSCKRKKERKSQQNTPIETKGANRPSEKIDLRLFHHRMHNLDSCCLLSPQSPHAAAAEENPCPITPKILQKETPIKEEIQDIHEYSLLSSACTASSHERTWMDHNQLENHVCSRPVSGCCCCYYHDCRRPSCTLIGLQLLPD